MTVEYEKKGRIAIITFNRPEVMNAIDLQARKELRAAFDDFRDDPDLWVAILTGAGDKAFCAGNDMKSTAMTDVQNQNQSETIGDYEITHKYELWKPVIAAINGFCLGAGLERALLCDLRIAADHAQLGLPEVKRGLIPLGGGPLRLPRMLNWCHASEMLLMGKHLTADEAYRIGLINKVVPLEQLMPTAMEWAEAICEASPQAVQSAKEAMAKGYETDLDTGQELVMSLWERIRNTEDYTEGRNAFLERRKPDYKNR